MMETPAAAHVSLSPREQEIVALIVKGLTYRQMAAQIGLTEETVKTYAGRVRQKLKLSSKVQIAVWAMQRPPQTGKRPAKGTA
jgi:two-component system nitrate/nitrite response regulator NarL